MLIDDSSFFRPTPFNFSAAMAQTALLAARPAFELQFFRTQEAILDKLAAEIDNIQNAVNTDGATALINLQIKQLQGELVFINEYKERTDKKVSRIGDTLSGLGDLLTLADPGTVAEFDARLAETIDLMQKTNTPLSERYGVPDRLRNAKLDGLAQLQALAHNNFATQADIDNATAIINDIQADYLASQPIVTSNSNIAFTLQTSANDTITELTRQASNIRTDALNAATDEIQAKQKEFGQALTALSLAFEVSQEFATFIAKSVALPQEIEPGSVVSLIA